MAHYDADGAGAIHTIRSAVICAQCNEGLHRAHMYGPTAVCKKEILMDIGSR